MSLAISGDLVVAEERARFMIAYDRIGASPDCGLSWFLPRRVGRGMAFRMMLTGQSLTAAEALAVRLIDRSASETEFDAVVNDLAKCVAAGPTQAFGHYKALIDGNLDLAAHLEAERQGFTACTRTADFAEGVEAFMAKRDPVFTGRGI